jgi:hypothetical protein
MDENITIRYAELGVRVRVRHEDESGPARSRMRWDGISILSDLVDPVVGDSGSNPSFRWVTSML